MSVKAKSGKTQVVVYLETPEYERLDNLRAKLPYKVSMSAYAGSVLKQHADKAVRKTA